MANKALQYLQLIYYYIKSKIWKSGGLKSKRNIFLIFVFLYSLWAFLKENGLWFKKSIKGKHIFLTGAGQGLGRLLAIRLAKKGAKLTITDINDTTLQQTKRMVVSQSKNDQIFAIQMDVGNREQISEVAQKCQEHYGSVDILINNAGIVQGKFITDMNEVLASKTMIVNAESNIWTAREFLPSMIKKNSGHVVTISSVAGMTGCAGMTDYCASKFAAFGFSESLRIEMKIIGKNVKCTTICPFFINTGMFAGVKPGLVSGFLDQFYVADRIVSAILQEEEEVVIPWRIGPLVHFSKLFLTAGMVDNINWFLGGWEMMSQFKGHGIGKNSPIEKTQTPKHLQQA